MKTPKLRNTWGGMLVLPLECHTCLSILTQWLLSSWPAEGSSCFCTSSITASRQGNFVPAVWLMPCVTNPTSVIEGGCVSEEAMRKSRGWLPFRDWHHLWYMMEEEWLGGSHLWLAIPLLLTLMLPAARVLTSQRGDNSSMWGRECPRGCSLRGTGRRWQNYSKKEGPKKINFNGFNYHKHWGGV